PWRLINGQELYDIKADPGQQKNVFAEQPARAAKMRAFYDAWWAELEPTFAQTTEIYLGHPEHPVVSLTGHDWIQAELPPWNQQHIRVADGFAPARPNAAKGKNAKAAAAPAEKSVHAGHWAVKVVTAGRYEISVRRWPVEANHPITAALPPGEKVPGASVAFRARPGVAIPATTATLRIGGRDLASSPVRATDTAIAFTTTLTAGSHQLAPVFTTADGHEVGAYYAVVTKLP
ncbi:MAG: N-acetylgalactosamine-4-sulfatase, partial [Verrucomicrobia bacterium]|nr:N-acetylgalactosamine-4-sulfatase [Verrucomicrobiota bacterium]